MGIEIVSYMIENLYYKVVPSMVFMGDENSNWKPNSGENMSHVAYSITDIAMRIIGVINRNCV